MNKHIDNAAYKAGMYCDGTPDSWDSEAIELFAVDIVNQCIRVIEDSDTHHAYTTYDLQLIEGTKEKVINLIKKHFAKDEK